MTFRILRNAALFSVTVAAVVAFAAVRAPGAPDASQASSDAAPDGTVAVHVFSETGELVGPVNMPVVSYTDAEWRLRLTEEQFRILRNDGTELAFCGTLLDNKLDGVYTCAGCGLPLFASDTKFDSGTGWPSFFSPVAKENIVYKEDRKFGMIRTEIICARCGSHLGHVFNDGPAPTGQRYCVNSESLNFTEYTDIKDIAEINEAVLAGGCFWCVEAVFEELDGVLYVESGYTGGDGPAEYSAVVTGATGHAEAIRIVYDPVVITYEQILEVHMATHDPTQLNRQGNDIGTHYRSAVFYANDEQKQVAAEYIKELGESGGYTRDIVTTLEPLGEFTRAEEYHQDYAKRNPNQPYIRGVSAPKVKKVRTLFEDMLKPKPSEAAADAGDEKSGEEAEG